MLAWASLLLVSRLLLALLEPHAAAPRALEAPRLGPLGGLLPRRVLHKADVPDLSRVLVLLLCAAEQSRAEQQLGQSERRAVAAEGRSTSPSPPSPPSSAPPLNTTIILRPAPTPTWLDAHLLRHLPRLVRPRARHRRPQRRHLGLAHHHHPRLRDRGLARAPAQTPTLNPLRRRPLRHPSSEQARGPLRRRAPRPLGPAAPLPSSPSS